MFAISLSRTFSTFNGYRKQRQRLDKYKNITCQSSSPTVILCSIVFHTIPSFVGRQQLSTITRYLGKSNTVHQHLWNALQISG